MEMPEYKIGKTIFGSAASIAAAYENFRRQPIDETRLADGRETPFPLKRTTISQEAALSPIFCPWAGSSGWKC